MLMKLSRKALCLLILLTIVISSSCSSVEETNRLLSTVSEAPEEENGPPVRQEQTESDEFMQKIKKEIIELARDHTKSPNQTKKARGNGNFPLNYNQRMRDRGKDSRKNRKLWGFMNDVVEIYEFCINPFYNVNYVKWCNNAFLGNVIKNDGKILFYFKSL